MIDQKWVGIGASALAFTASLVGVFAGIGPAILVLTAGVLVGTIASFWVSLRVLAGDSILPPDLVVVARMAAIESAEDRKRSLLRTLKDLEHEHAVGKLSDADYAELVESYRNHVKAVMREMDATLEPLRKRAEALAENHLKGRGITPAGTDRAKPTDAA